MTPTETQAAADAVDAVIVQTHLPRCYAVIAKLLAEYLRVVPAPDTRLVVEARRLLPSSYPGSFGQKP